MNLVEKIIYYLQATMERPTAYGWFHLLCLFLTFLAIAILYKFRRNDNEKQLKSVLLIYGVIALLLEILKQVIMSFEYEKGIVIWDYQWYSSPFQLCTTPIFVTIICAFLKDNKIRRSLFSYLSFVTILGSFMTMIIPDSCFVSTIEINIHTMWLHCGSFVVSVYLLMTGYVKLNKNSLKRAMIVFLIFLIIAQVLNISIYNSGILNGETFNMFYVSPYFISELPVYNIIQEIVPYVLFLIFYIFSIFAGALIVFLISKLINKLFLKFK